MKKRSKAIIVIALLLAILAPVALISILLDSQSDTRVAPFSFPAIVGNGSDGYEERANAKATIPAVGSIQLHSDMFEQNVSLYNPEKNPCVFVISLYLGDGTKVFETEPLYPGDMVTKILTTVKLKAGVYHNAILVYDCYTADGAMTPLTRCELVVEINSI